MVVRAELRDLNPLAISSLCFASPSSLLRVEHQVANIPHTKHQGASATDAHNSVFRPPALAYSRSRSSHSRSTRSSHVSTSSLRPAPTICSCALRQHPPEVRRSSLPGPTCAHAIRGCTRSLRPTVLITCFFGFIWSIVAGVYYIRARTDAYSKYETSFPSRPLSDNQLRATVSKHFEERVGEH